MNIVDAVYSGGLYDKYLDPDVFRTFAIENGNVAWGDDWDMIFPVEILYSGRIQ